MAAARNRHMPIYTKKGDRGKTGLPGGVRISKTDQLFEVLGNLDQTSATIGLAISYLNTPKLSSTIKLLRSIQSDLLSLGICLASKEPNKFPALKKLSKRVKNFENNIDKWEDEIGELKNFIIVGGCPAGACLHLARATARKTERDFHKLTNKPVEISKYLNRLSDLLFQSARFVNYRYRSIEPNWNNL